MTVERWFSLYFPIKAKLLCTVHTAKRISLSAIFLSAIYNAQDLFVVELKQAGGREFCSFISSIPETYIIIYELIQALITAYIPFVVMFVCNTAIIVKLLKNNKIGDAGPIGKGTSKLGKQATVMLLCVTSVFIILTFPVTMFVQISGSALRENKVALVICGNVFFINNSINTLLYMLSGSRYRESFRNMFKCFRHNRISDNTGSSNRSGENGASNST